jgi:2-polyprenyl-6-methoxyphenol hydroxylase-like FAD-dependent oxidoreductase
MSQLKVIIVGGGLSGALLGNGLLRAGISVVVYERDVADTKREGYQIRLGEPALMGFRACLGAELIAQIEEKYSASKPQSASDYNTRTFTAPYVYSSNFEPCLDLSAIPNYTASTTINRVVLRNFLIEPLKQHGCIKFEKKFSHYKIIYDPAEVEKVQVHFSDGSFDSCDILVGADGSGSEVRITVYCLSRRFLNSFRLTASSA